MMGVEWSVTEYRGPQGLAELETDWRRLYREMPSAAMWHSHEAYTAYVRHLCPAPEEFRCFALSDSVRIRAILPIEERQESGRVGGSGGGLLRVWGMPQRVGWPTNDAIGPEDGARAALLPAVIARLREQAKRPALLVIGRARGESVLWNGLTGIGSRARFVFADRSEFVIPTDMSIDAFLARLRSKSRRALRHAGSKLEALDGVRFVRATSREDLAVGFDALIAVEMSGWKGESGTAIGQHPEIEAFFRDLLGTMSLDGHCEIHTLYVGDHCVAAAYCVFTPGMCAVFKSGYDEAYSEITPGRLVTQKTFEWCCEDPDVKVVSHIGDAPWLGLWRPDSNEIKRAYVSLRLVSGALILPALRFWYRPLRSGVRAVKAWKRDRLPSTQTHRGRDAV